MKVKIGIANGKGGQSLHIRNGGHWWLIAGEPYKNKNFEIKQTLELDVPLMLIKIAHVMRDENKQMELFK